MGWGGDGKVGLGSIGLSSENNYKEIYQIKYSMDSNVVLEMPR